MATPSMPSSWARPSTTTAREKVGYTAPSIEGQVEAIVKAQAAAGVTAETSSYVEAHGTATPLGDPIEVAALTKAFPRAPIPKQSCVLGSLKSNLGHLDAAAGVTGPAQGGPLPRARAHPRHAALPGPNPELTLEASPFFVNARAAPVAARGAPAPRRRERLRHRWNQRPRHPGGGARARAVRPFAPLAAGAACPAAPPRLSRRPPPG